LNDTHKLLGNKDTSELKAQIDTKVRYDALSSFVEASTRAKKYMRAKAKEYAIEMADREQKAEEKSTAITSNIQNENHQRANKLYELKELNKKRENAVKARNARLKDQMRMTKEINKLKQVDIKENRDIEKNRRLQIKATILLKHL
jgi:hypothetical protein